MQAGKKKKLIIANSFLLTFLLIGIVFAWFVNKTSNEISSNDVTVIADGALELSVDGGETWLSAVSLSDYDWFRNVKFTDITGSGDGTFLRPTLKQYSGYAEVDNTGEWTVPKVNEDYVSFTLKMRSTDKLNVYLGADSAVTTADDGKFTSGYSNKSGYGDFSKDAVVGALRVGVTKDNEHMFTWIPRPEVFVNSTGIINKSNIVTSATSGESFNHTYIASNYNETTLSSDKVITKRITENTKQLLSSLSTKSAGSSFYEDEVQINIWLEGCDKEARRAFVGGEFKAFLNIVSEDPIQAQ